MLMYGYGLRMSEEISLRIKDIDFGFNKVCVWESKSLKDRLNKDKIRSPLDF